jgi:hypothetical protein
MAVLFRAVIFVILGTIGYHGAVRCTPGRDCPPLIDGDCLQSGIALITMNMMACSQKERTIFKEIWREK